MMGKKVDRRIVRTRAAMRKALIELLIDTDYSKITVTAIARKADIDRKTFYTHYATVGDLFEDALRHQVDDVLHDIDLLDFLRDPKSCAKSFLCSLDRAFYLPFDQKRILADHVPPEEYLRCWTAVLQEHIVEQTGELSADVKHRVKALLDFYIGGMTNTYISWIRSDMPIPFEDLCEILSESAVNGLSGVARRYVALNAASVSSQRDKSTCSNNGVLA